MQVNSTLNQLHKDMEKPKPEKKQVEKNKLDKSMAMVRRASLVASGIQIEPETQIEQTDYKFIPKVKGYEDLKKRKVELRYASFPNSSISTENYDTLLA